MKVTVLGCGSSGGVPLIGNIWGACDPSNPKNRRTRTSILVEEGGTVVLVDTSPDMRQQLLACDLKRLDAVLYTHAHADHCHGLDDLRSVNWLMQKPIDLYADPQTLKELGGRFPYIFHSPGNGNFFKPSILPHEITEPFNIGPLCIKPFAQRHDFSHSLGFRFGDFAYSTDTNGLDENAFEVLRGVKTWIVDCVRVEPHPTHAHLKQTLEWIDRVKPQRAYLTHMSHEVDYEALLKILPEGVRPAHDGLVLEC